MTFSRLKIVSFRLKNNTKLSKRLDFIHRRSGQCNHTSVFICILSILVINDNDTVPMTLWPWLPLPCAAPKRSCSIATPVWFTCEMKSRNRRNSISSLNVSTLDHRFISTKEVQKYYLMEKCLRERNIACCKFIRRNKNNTRLIWREEKKKFDNKWGMEKFLSRYENDEIIFWKILNRSKIILLSFLFTFKMWARFIVYRSLRKCWRKIEQHCSRKFRTKKKGICAAWYSRLNRLVQVVGI